MAEMEPKLPPGTFSLTFFPTLLPSAKLYTHKWQDGAIFLVFLPCSWCLMSKSLMYMFNGGWIVLKPSSSTSLTRVPKRAQVCNKWGVMSSTPMGLSQTGKRGGCVLCYMQIGPSGLLGFSWMEPFPCYLLRVRLMPRTSSWPRCLWFKVKETNLSFLK